MWDHILGSVTRTRTHKPTIATPNRMNPKKPQPRRVITSLRKNQRRRHAAKAARGKEACPGAKLFERERVGPWKPRRREGLCVSRAQSRGLSAQNLTARKLSRGDEGDWEQPVPSAGPGPSPASNVDGADPGTPLLPASDLPPASHPGATFRGTQPTPFLTFTPDSGTPTSSQIRHLPLPVEAADSPGRRLPWPLHLPVAGLLFPPTPSPRTRGGWGGWGLFSSQRRSSSGAPSATQEPPT